MLQTVILINQAHDGTRVILLGQREWVPGRKTPRTLHKPWEHRITLPRYITQADVFAAIELALKALAKSDRA